VPDLGGSDGQHHARTYDMTFAFELRNSFPIAVEIVQMPPFTGRKAGTPGPEGPAFR
jgi:hypothetical protein